MFFLTNKLGHKEKDSEGNIKGLIISLRKKYLSVPDIKAIVDSQGYKTSEKYIYHVLKREGFDRLPRRAKQDKEIRDSSGIIKAPESAALLYISEEFSTLNSIGILCLLPYIRRYGIDEAIEKSQYPETSSINKLSSILGFIALKLSNIRRYSADDLWCMDRGLGLFMHIPAQADQSFWSKSTTDSGAFHPVIPLGSRPLFC